MAKQQQKNSFSSHIGLIIAGAAVAVGLGNIWRFPAEVAKYGGGIYLLMYIFFTLTLGYPLVLSELALGRSKGNGSFGAFKGKWSFLGWATTFICYTILTFYNVITGWVIGYFLKATSGELLEAQDLQVFFQTFKGDVKGNLLYTLFVVICLGIINRASIASGIERVCKVAMPGMLVIIFILVFFACSLDCAREGLTFYLWPNWQNFSYEGLTSALAQSFLSLGVGSGILITYGSYASKKEHLPVSAGVIVFSDLLVAFLAGCFLFPLLACEKLKFDDQGPALTFINLPLIFQKMGPTSGFILGVSFFLLLFLAAITSAMGLVEVPSQYLQSRYKLSRSTSVWLILLSNFLISLWIILGQANHPLYVRIMGSISLIDWLDFLAIEYGEVISAYCFCLFVYSQWRRESLLAAIQESRSMSPWLAKYVGVVVAYIAPLVIFCLVAGRLLLAAKTYYYTLT